IYTLSLHDALPILTMVEAVLPAVSDGPIREERRPALADALQDLLRSDDVQKRVLLAGERRRRQIFRRRARAHGIGGAFVAEPPEGARDLVSDVLGDGSRFDRAADLGGGEPVIDRDDAGEGLGGNAEAVRNVDPLDAGQLSEVRGFAAGERELRSVDTGELE